MHEDRGLHRFRRVKLFRVMPPFLMSTVFPGFEINLNIPMLKVKTLKNLLS